MHKVFKNKALECSTPLKPPCILSPSPWLKVCVMLMGSCWINHLHDNTLGSSRCTNCSFTPLLTTAVSSFIRQAQIYAEILYLPNFRAKAQAELQLNVSVPWWRHVCVTGSYECGVGNFFLSLWCFHLPVLGSGGGEKTYRIEPPDPVSLSKNNCIT